MKVLGYEHRYDGGSKLAAVGAFNPVKDSPLDLLYAVSQHHRPDHHRSQMDDSFQVFQLGY